MLRPQGDRRSEALTHPIDTYARAAFANGYAEVEGALPLGDHLDVVTLALGAAVAVARAHAGSPVVLEAIHQTGKQEAMRVAVNKRRDTLEAKYRARLSPVLHAVLRHIATTVARKLAPQEAIAPLPDPREVVDAAVASLPAELRNEWAQIIEDGYTDAMAQGRADGAIMIASGRGLPLPSFDIELTQAVDAIREMGLSVDVPQWLDQQLHATAYQLGGDLADALSNGASYSDLLGIISDQGVEDSGAGLMLDYMLGRGVDDGSKSLYADEGLEEVDLLVSGDACDDCLDAESRNPYPLADAPQCPLHPKCRCGNAPHV